MRISTSFQFDLQLARMAMAQQRYVEAERQVATGRRFETAAEDPYGSSLVVRYAALRRVAEQSNANLRVAKDYAGNSENALGEAHTLVRRAYELAVRGANASQSVESMQAMAREVETVQRQLLALANSRGAQGQYLFAGQLNDAAPFSVDDGALVYAGDGNPVLIETAPGQTLAVNTSGNPLFVDVYAALQALRTHLEGGDHANVSDLDIPALQDAMRALTSARGETGARMKTIDGFEQQNLRRIDELSAQISDVQDVDLAEAIQRFKQAELAYQAALQSTVAAQNLSLMDFLK